MPGLARKVLVCAAVDGLILQPLHSKKDQQRPSPLIKIKYGTASVSHASRDSVPELSDPDSSFEAFGIVGILTVFRYSYLISITGRQQIAQIRGNPIYVVTEVALTPCTSQNDAAEAVAKTALALSNREAAHSDDDTASEDDAPRDSGSNDEAIDDVLDPTEEEESSGETGLSAVARSSVAQDVIARRGSYGRFAKSWFSRSGWTMDQKRNMGLSAEQLERANASKSAEAKKGSDAAKRVPRKFPLPSDAVENDSAAVSLLPKLLRTTQILFGSSRTFYFSYDYDITRSAANPAPPGTPSVPLVNHVDPTFFWNKNVMQPFIDAGVDSLALPLMQGFVGQRTFTVDSNPPQVDDGAKDSLEMKDMDRDKKPEASTGAEGESEEARPTEKKFDITVISRRSTKRAGLRYLRRGIDEGGNVANCVESEQILSPTEGRDDPDARVYSFVQIRGSFPVFFTQSPYSLKPAPVLQHSSETNYAALKKHFEWLRSKYGLMQCVNLVEKHGVEAPIGQRYEENIKRLNEEEAKSEDEQIAFEWFDFHHVCRGMKFENVSVLLETLGPRLEKWGSTVIVNDEIKTQQLGAFRTNCMDCLDRTNVCQSSFAKYMLDAQLKEMGFDMNLQKDQENAWFNTLWADNGDAISKQYASTGAMKGDYTRTRKRNYRGALTDAGLSLTRLFNGMFNDFFLQTTIDFLLGNVTSLVFEEFEANMMTKDPAMSMQRMREQAIELSQKRVIADESEEFIGGWTLLTPNVPDTIRSSSFEEAVLLLTDKALYLCRFDWNLDKVSSFERVDLAHVTKIKFGTYITSTISSAQVDEMRNVGLIVEYKPGVTDITRVNTRSLSTSVSAASKMGREPTSGIDAGEQEPQAAKDAAAAAISEEKPAASAAAPIAGIAEGIAGFFTPRSSTQEPPARKIALKALHSITSAADPMAKAKEDEPGAITRLSEMQQIILISSEIERLAIRSQPKLQAALKKDGQESSGLVEKGDIISLAEAKKNTGLLEQLGHSIKKMVWA
ncbi:SacI homology domain-containing protein [Sordaria brevicollis]|uniref:SacI homology domain-containing protein n=1 Tax=Sordaria brevicollis TaxID=83679 RepID=A0AAE0UH81_SORBR|nr:SacI homology domain-containing protein [Sordaria brevicollis]